MRPVHAFATTPHFIDHLAPVWLGLEPDERGTFYVQSRGLALHATRQGIGTVSINRRPPNTAGTLVDGHQPHVLVASPGDGSMLGTRRRTVLLEHGAGQTYGGDPYDRQAATSVGYAGGVNRDTVDLFLTPNEDVAAANRARYPNAAHAVVGCPKLDRWHGWQPGPVEERRPAVTFHWPCRLTPEAGTAWGHYRQWFEDAPRLTAHGRIMGHAHPRHASHLSRWWPRAGAEWVGNLDTVFESALVFIADNTSAMFEAAAIGIPVVVLNAPQYRRQVHHGLRFWTFADIGPQVDHPSELEDAVGAAFHPSYRVRRGQMTRTVYGDLDGHATDRAVAALRRHLP